EPRPRDHDDGKVERACGVDLGAGAGSAGIAGDDPFDIARAHHLELGLEREGSARDDDVRIGQWQRLLGRIDKSQRIGLLRQGTERRDMLAADCEKYIGTTLRQGRDRGCDVRDLDPAVAGGPLPGRAFEREQRCRGLRAGGDRVAAHLGREGVRRVDHMGDAFTTQIIGKAADAAEAADAGRQRLLGRRVGAAAIGIDRVDPRAADRSG
ncbi:hypothetical protein chiPu_0031774, partial [Chiloscyllium punctatum]|nr:hypothetical protein [Chiloscyllium punctatum]